MRYNCIQVAHHGPCRWLLAESIIAAAIALRLPVDRFIARENIKHYRRELENGVDGPTRATMLKLLTRKKTTSAIHGSI
jgi:hypothetical protein